MGAKSEKTPRVTTRDETTKFRVAFFEDDMTTPLVPLDPGAYPAFSIYDINNLVIANGVGVADIAPGFWLTEFKVPKDADLSNDIKRWRIEWTMVSTINTQTEFVEEFDVRDIIITADEDRSIRKLALAKRAFRVTLRQTVKPVELVSTVFLATSSGDPGEAKHGPLSFPPSGDIVEICDGDSFLYSYEIPAGVLVEGCDFTVLWEITETLAATPNYEFTPIAVVPFRCLEMIPMLRMIIDKFQKKLGSFQAYEDSDLHFYLQRGLEFVNAFHPFTTFSFGSCPRELMIFVLFAAGWVGLNAQHLLEVDLQFGFGGQQVTLDYDHTAGLDSALQRYMDFLTTNLPAAKLAIVRRNQPVGTVATRPVRYTGLHNFVYRISSVNGGQVADLLQFIGLL